MELVTSPTTLQCSECGSEIEDAGYLPAAEREDGYEPTPADAMCAACGFNEVGMMGCAPTLEEVTAAGSNDVLLYVNATDGGFDVISVKECRGWPWPLETPERRPQSGSAEKCRSEAGRAHPRHTAARKNNRPTTRRGEWLPRWP